MISAKRGLVDTGTNGSHEYVLLIAADGDEAARVLGELDSVTEERFRVEWVTGISAGVDRLREGGVGAAVLDIDLSDNRGLAMVGKLSEAAPDVPILILSDANAEGIARQAVEHWAEDYLVKKQTDGYRLRRSVRMMMDRHAAARVWVENEVAKIMLNSIGEAVLRTDIRGRVTYLNRLAERMTGWFRDEALGHPVEDVLRLTKSSNGSAFDSAAAIVMQEDGNKDTKTNCTSCTLIRRDGFEFGIENIVTVVNDPEGAVIGAVMAFRDVSSARAASLEMSREARHDVLTNLPNRTLFNDRLKQALSLGERQSKRLAVLFVDIDQFKRINDSLGHAVGDHLLRSVAGRLTACVRRTDTVSRIGGDEFLILLSQVEHAEDAALSARKIIRAVAAPHIIDNKSLDINVSIGGSTFPDDGVDADSLVTQADAAMYEAKQNGRNNYQCFRPDMRTRLAKRLLLEGDLRYAMGRNEFRLDYQPQIDLQTGKITGVEALIRWLHPDMGVLLPAAFVPIAEESGLILPIGQWVLLEACKQAQAWEQAGLGIVPVAVNVSAAEFRAKDFLSGVRAVLIATGVEPLNLELELTESVLMQDAESAVVTLMALKAMGVHLAIDDFGTGYSSFTYLRRFPVDTLKVDQSFVQEITGDPAATTVVSAMISIGKSLKQRVIAEGIETKTQLDFLQEHECGEGQGFYFARPLAAEQAGKMFEAGLHSGIVN